MPARYPVAGRSRRATEARRHPLLSLNKHELADMQELAQKWKTEFRFDPLLRAGHDGSRKPLAYRVPADEVASIESNDATKSDAWTKRFARLYGSIPPNGSLYLCTAGIDSFHIQCIWEAEYLHSIETTRIQCPTRLFSRGMERGSP